MLADFSFPRLSNNMKIEIQIKNQTKVTENVGQKIEFLIAETYEHRSVRKSRD